MFTDRRASEIPQFVVVLAIAVALGATVIWSILSSARTEGSNVSTFIDGVNVPAAP